MKLRKAITPKKTKPPRKHFFWRPRIENVVGRAIENGFGRAMKNGLGWAKDTGLGRQRKRAWAGTGKRVWTRKSCSHNEGPLLSQQKTLSHEEGSDILNFHFFEEGSDIPNFHFSRKGRTYQISLFQ